MTDATENIGYYSVIPWPVLSSQGLSDKAKLVYGVIVSMTREKGYCWASNEALAAMMRCGERTISRAINDLADAGELVVTMVADASRVGNRERRIYTRETASRSVEIFGVDKTGSTANFGETGLDKNGETLNRYDNKRPNKPPISPPQGDKRAEPKVCAWKEKRFLRFWKFYRETFCAADTGRAGERARAATSWDKLRPDDEAIFKMGAKLEAIMRTRQWQDGIGIQYASTFLNGVRMGKISLDDLPAPANQPRSAPPEPVREEDQWI